MRHSLKNRIFVGIAIGIVAGIVANLILEHLGVSMTTEYMIGLTLLYVLLGILLAFAGLYDRHPLFDFSINRWMRGLFFGVLTHLVLVLLNVETIQYITKSMDVWGMLSPYRALLDGAILGLIMSYAETKIAGEGDIPKR